MAGTDRTWCDTEYGTVSEGIARQMAGAARIAVDGPYVAGVTEPWVIELVGSLCKAVGAHTILETGSFLGHTTAHLAQCLQDRGGGRLIACEIDPDRARQVHERLIGLTIPDVAFTVYAQDVQQVVAHLKDGELDAVFVDDDHQSGHVASEIDSLLPKMRAGGLLLFHDVFGSCDLQRIVRAYGGYCLDLPRNGPAGGLGILQR